MATRQHLDPSQPGAGSRVDSTVAIPGGASLLAYLVAGTLFGIILVKSEVVSWFRIQEMFRFQSIHMYGIMGSAMMTAALSLRVLKSLGVRTLGGDVISVPPKEMGSGRRYAFGGIIFGIGWALTGTCPGPLFALMGTGASVFVVVAAAALAGTLTYGYTRARLPH
ncbi:MAG: DUF6691 family protein [Gemmatimonadaceae bacterium]